MQIFFNSKYYSPTGSMLAESTDAEELRADYKLCVDFGSCAGSALLTTMLLKDQLYNELELKFFKQRVGIGILL